MGHGQKAVGSGQKAECYKQHSAFCLLPSSPPRIRHNPNSHAHKPLSVYLRLGKEIAHLGSGEQLDLLNLAAGGGLIW